MKIMDLTLRFSKFSPRERALSVAGGMVMLLLLLDMAIVTPLWNYYVSLNERAEAEESRLEQNMINITMKDSIEQRFEKYRKFIREPVSNEEEVAMMLSEIEKLARDDEVSLADIKPDDTVDQGSFKECRVELDVESEMQQLIKFIKDLEASDQLMRVVKARLNLKDKDSRIIKAKLSVTKVVIS